MIGLFCNDELDIVCKRELLFYVKVLTWRGLK
jgi:hypothetical protein